jgi:hypothetical protein
MGSASLTGVTIPAYLVNAIEQRFSKNSVTLHPRPELAGNVAQSRSSSPVSASRPCPATRSR